MYVEEDKRSDKKKILTYKLEMKRQSGSFLNRYDFTYAGRDTVNRAAMVAPGVIKAATSDINNIAEQRINQIILQGGKERVNVSFPKL